MMHELPPMGKPTGQPVAGLFFGDPADPEAGGTGHSIRVCRNAGVPVVFQNHCAAFLERLPECPGLVGVQK